MKRSRAISVQAVKSLACAIFLWLGFVAAAQADIENLRKAELLNFLEQDCGSCHGLKRNGGLGSPLHPENLEGRDNDVLVDIVLNGIAETAMPPWKAIINEEEAYFLIDHLRKGIKK